MANFSEERWRLGVGANGSDTNVVVAMLHEVPITHNFVPRPGRPVGVVQRVITLYNELKSNGQLAAFKKDVDEFTSLGLVSSTVGSNPILIDIDEVSSGYY